MVEDRKKNNHGGVREGAGRKRSAEPGRLFSFRASGKMSLFLESRENRTEFIRKTLDTAIRSQDKAPESIGKSIPASRVKSRALPYFDIRVVAGFPVPLDNDEKSQDIDILRLLCPHPEASYLIRVNGDSMIDAGVCSGDIVIVDKSRRDPSSKEIAVCELNGEYTLKRFVEENGEGWLVPANPAYPRFRVTEDDDFSIWGTVTYIIHKARD